MAAEIGHEDATTVSTVIMATGLGLVGGTLSVLFGPDRLTPWQRIGCIAAGGACAFVLAPLIVVVYPAANERVISLAGFVLGIGGLFIVRGTLAWWSRIQGKIPSILDRQTGTDSSEEGSKQ